jgi:hypothetical protein
MPATMRRNSILHRCGTLKVRRFLQERSDDRHVTSMTINDLEHYTEEEKQKIIASYPPHELEARTKGIPVLGSGRIFPVEESRIAIEHREFPCHWPRIGRMASDTSTTLPPSKSSGTAIQIIVEESVSVHVVNIRFAYRTFVRRLCLKDRT